MVSFWPRINTVLILITFLTVTGLFAGRAFGGPLDPPGIPGSTDGVRGPGTPIDHLPFPITEGGYYYVTRNLSGGAGQNGITISASNVTVDLGGFTLFGGASPGDGISASGPRYVVIRNGNVRGWNTGINLVTTYSRVEHITASNNSYAGVIMSGESILSDCIASINQVGIQVDNATVRNCTVAENQFGIYVVDDSLIEGNRVSVNSARGLDVAGTRNKIVDNQLAGNSGTDVYLGNSVVTYNVITGNVYCTGADFGLNNTYAGNYC